MSCWGKNFNLLLVAMTAVNASLMVLVEVWAGVVNIEDVDVVNNIASFSWPI